MKINIAHYVKFTCWTSIVLLLWGLVMQMIPVNTFAPWFSLIFFALIGLVAWATDKK